MITRFFILFFVGGLMVGSCVAQPTKDVYDVSIKAIQLERNERIVGFRIHLQTARIKTLPDIPIGWSVEVNNDPSWNTSVSAAIIVGAAALEPAYFIDFMSIERPPNSASDLAQLQLKIEIEITVTVDFDATRTLKYGMKDLILRQRNADKAKVMPAARKTEKRP